LTGDERLAVEHPGGVEDRDDRAVVARIHHDLGAADDTIAFSPSLTTYARAYRIKWRGQFRLIK
jgi:hypothetical protein